MSCQPPQNKAKEYSSRKYFLAITDVLYLLAVLFLFSASGASKNLASAVSQITTNYYLLVPLYFLAAYILYYFLDFPLNFYRSFALEHRFGLSKQKISDWLKDQLKTAVIGYVIALVLIEAFYYILKTSPYKWWAILALFWIFFSLVLARLVPVIIIPLFFKYKKLSDGVLRERIIGLAGKMQVKVLDVFEIDFSKKTLKANAAFVGIGATRRVILADTLRDKYSYEEIEVILAHEFAHYRLRHLLKLIAVNSLAIIASFYLIFKTNSYVLGFFGFSSLLDITAFPVVLIYLTLFGIITQPFENYISRRLERNADMLALKTTGLKEAFVSLMDKLGIQNLADRTPHALIKFFFFDHPPLDERIAMAKSTQL